jgi:Copper type II ascorbate-dependent monooxygenase, C-terminal domain
VYTVRQPEFTVQKGDSFISTCFFQSDDVGEFGSASYDEMCLTYLVYFPAKRIFNRGPWSCGYGIPLESCNATVTDSIFVGSDGITNALVTSDSLRFFDRTFGLSSNAQCLEKPTNLTSLSTSGGVIISMVSSSYYFLWIPFCFMIHWNW